MALQRPLEQIFKRPLEEIFTKPDVFTNIPSAPDLQWSPDAPPRDMSILPAAKPSLPGPQFVTTPQNIRSPTRERGHGVISATPEPTGFLRKVFGYKSPPRPVEWDRASPIEKIAFATKPISHILTRIGSKATRELGLITKQQSDALLKDEITEDIQWYQKSPEAVGWGMEKIAEYKTLSFLFKAAGLRRVLTAAGRKLAYPFMARQLVTPAGQQTLKTLTGAGLKRLARNVLSSFLQAAPENTAFISSWAGLDALMKGKEPKEIRKASIRGAGWGLALTGAFSAIGNVMKTPELKAIGRRAFVRIMHKYPRVVDALSRPIEDEFVNEMVREVTGRRGADVRLLDITKRQMANLRNAARLIRKEMEKAARKEAAFKTYWTKTKSPKAVATKVKPAEKPLTMPQVAKKPIAPKKPVRPPAKPPAAKPAPPAGKEAWEMTREEWFAHKFNKLPKKVQKQIRDRKQKHFVNIEEIREQTDDEHRRDIQYYLSKGKPVPREVLEEYSSEKWAQEALKAKGVPKPTLREPSVISQTELYDIEKRLGMEIIDRFGLKANNPETFGKAVERLLRHEEEIIPPENEQNFINAIRNLQREAGLAQEALAKKEKPAAEGPPKGVRDAGFVDLTPITEAGEQIKTVGAKAAKHITRFGGVEAAVRKSLIEYEEQLRELPKIAAKDSVKKFGNLTEEQERAIENHIENPAKYPDLPKNLQKQANMVKAGQKWAGKVLEDLGYPANWPETYIQRLEKKLAKLQKKEIIDPEQEQELVNDIKEARDLKYLHHQYRQLPTKKRIRQWMHRRITKKPRGLLGRKIPTYEKAEAMGLERAPLAVSYAHMLHEASRAQAANELIQAINKNPNLSAWENEAHPEDWRRLDSTIFPEGVQRQAWVSEGDRVAGKMRFRVYAPPVAEAIEEIAYSRGNEALERAYDRLNFALKIVGFYNPLVMTKNDLVQMWRAAGFKSILPVGLQAKFPFVRPGPLARALATFIKKGPEYQMLRKAGLFNNVVNYTPAVKELTQQMLDKIRLSKGRRTAKVAADWLNPLHIHKDLRKFNEATTWNLDEIIRIGCWETVKDSRMLKGLTEFEKAEWVNDAMVNYAKLPKSTKRWLGKALFVPTYRIGNFRYFWGRIAKHPWRFKGPLLRTVGYKMFIQWGLPAIIAAAVAYKLGKKKEVWTEKGYRVVVTNPKTGKDTVYSLSDPLLEGAKLTQRPVRMTLLFNIAPIPNAIIRMFGGPRFTRSKDPVGEFFKLGTPIYRDIANWKDPDKTVPQKILTQMAIAYTYSRKARLQDKETASKALAKALSIWTDWKEQTKDVEKMLGRRFYSQMSEKEIRTEISKNTYKKKYKRKDGSIHFPGSAHQGKERHVASLRKELSRRKK